MTAVSAQLHPARLPYTIFSDRNPWMGWVRWAADLARENRSAVAEDNPGRVAERQVSQVVTQALQAYGRQRDALSEAWFQKFYAAPFVQSVTGVAGASAPPRPHPGDSPEHRHFVALATESLRAGMTEGGLLEAVLRALLWIRLPAGQADERSFSVIRRLRREYGPQALPLPEFKRIVRQQFFMLLIDEARAIEMLPALLPDNADQRAKAFAMLNAVVTSVGDMSSDVRSRLSAMEHVFLTEEAPAPLMDTSYSPAVVQPAAAMPGRHAQGGRRRVRPVSKGAV